jgi:phage-related protein
MATPFPAYTAIYPVTKKVRPKLFRTFLPGPAGIERRARNGANQTAPEYDVVFFLPIADIDTIDAFLADRARLAERFEWTSPDPGAVAAEYVCEQWNKTVLSHNMGELKGTFKRSFTFI